MDAEQWAVLNVPNRDQSNRVVCTMPSPDAMAAAAASGSLAVDNPGGTGGSGGFAIGESAGSIGLRTQSIQLLRDAMFRICESYANGGIDDAELGIMMRRFQSSMVAILAIEQLTGAVVAPPISVSASSESSVLNTLIRERRELEREIADIDTRLAVSADEGGPSATERTSLEQRKTRRESELTLYATAMTNIATGDFAGADLVLGGVSGRNGPSGEDLAAVAQTVESITLAAMGTQDNFHEEMCFEMARLASVRDRENPDSPFVQYCSRLATQNVVERTNMVRQVDDAVAVLLRDGQLSDEEVAALRALLAQTDRHFTAGDLREFSPEGPDQ